MDVINKFKNFKHSLSNNVRIVVVSKNISFSYIEMLYNSGHVHFGETYIKELLFKYSKLPKDIKWHMIGNLQSNKIKYITSFIYMIHSIKSIRQLFLINEGGRKYNRSIKCLLQVKISQEKTKTGFNIQEIYDVFDFISYQNMYNIQIVGLMGIASNTQNIKVLNMEFKLLYEFFIDIKQKYSYIKYLSMGMSNDYKIAIQYGANIIRIGRLIFN
jgi:hypothetical protein